MSYKAAATWKVICDQGKTFYRKIKYIENGTPFDLTAYEARMMVRRNYQTATPALDLDSTTGDIVLGGALGIIEITVSAVPMEALVGDYVFDLELYDPTDPDIVIGVVRGTITVRPEATYE